jgi:hypothetical protein
MEYRFTLSHSAFPDKVISEPQGFDKAQLKLLRHEEFHSLVEYYEGEFIFYGADQFDDGGIDYIREIESSYGHDTDLRITIEVAPDGYTYETLFIGLLNLAELEELPDNKMQIPVIRDDFWSKFINRQETQVDIQSSTTLDNTSADQFDSINIKLLSQKIPYKFSDTEITTLRFTDNPGDPLGIYYQVGDFIQISWNESIELDEIRERYNIPTAINSELPVFQWSPEFGGEYIFDFQLPVVVLEQDAPSGTRYPSAYPNVKFFIKKNDESSIEFTPNVVLIGTSISGVDIYCTFFQYNGTLELNPFDEVRIYGEVFSNFTGNLSNNFWIFGNTPFTILGKDVGGLIGQDQWYGRIVANTVYPDTNSPAFFIHDVGGQICDRITGEDNTFYSEILGGEQTVYRQYDDNGCYWDYVEAKGLQIRRYSLSEKPFFQSFKQWWEGVNPIFNLGLGYDTFNNQQIIRVEDKRYFYDDSEVSLNISNVRDIVRKYDDNRLFKTVKIGYKKWQSEDISGLDDPQTKKTYATRLRKSGKDITIESEFIAASLAIETTRRKTREKSADYKFDNDTFIIAIRPDAVHVSPETSPDVTDYAPELDENFSLIENLLNYETRYNIRLTPARNFLRWVDWLSAGLQSYPIDPFKFTSGEGNYDMVSIAEAVNCDNYLAPLSEKQDLDISNDPFHLALMYEIRVPLTWEEYSTIRADRKKAIGISQTEEDHVKFFIQELSYTPERGEALITAWPVEPLVLRTIETYGDTQSCATDCDDTYLSEDLFEFETEDENCLVLN